MPTHLQATDARPATLGDPPTRRLHLAVLALGLLWLLFWYRDTFLAMVGIWDRSDTFAHGFVIAPISAWLVWRRRHFIDHVPIAHSLLGICAGLVAGAAWLLGELASVDAVSQFAFVGMLVGFVWAVWGSAVVRTYAFPIGFLFFMVPFGEFLFPTMMQWTADFIIWAVRASGVPVYAEGYNLVIPSGRWQVVEGCSGLLTRPRRESRETAQVLEAHGIASIRMPLQATRRAPASPRLAADLAWAGGAAIQIFVSRAAVAAAAALAPSQLATADRRIAVGAATAAALERLGWPALRAPGHAEDSDGILGLPSLQSVAGERIAIWAAPGGRDRMAIELSRRGADVRAVMVYRRLPQRPRPAALRRLHQCAPDLVLSASSGLLLQALDAVLIVNTSRDYYRSNKKFSGAGPRSFVRELQHYCEY